ncbi:hypothetical protein [Arthrobacter rhombi]|uniref:hypothetical protein n=1 Tax=Arthrobacter rhombi TaxID=71253 RepID=UPI000B355F49|nr:hypothetical protein [Arthrobacter rhombi]
MDDPSLLLSGSAYGGGDTMMMDPFHPASGLLNSLRFASTSGDPDAMEFAVAKAVDTIAKHGVPNQVESVHSVGERAKAFEPVQLVGAMPTINADTSWSQRADGAQTIVGAMAAMPAKYQARDAIQNYAAALANPKVESGTVGSLKIEAISAIEVAAGYSGAGERQTSDTSAYRPATPTSTSESHTQRDGPIMNHGFNDPSTRVQSAHSAKPNVAKPPFPPPHNDPPPKADSPKGQPLPGEVYFRPPARKRRRASLFDDESVDGEMGLPNFPEA